MDADPFCMIHTVTLIQQRVLSLVAGLDSGDDERGASLVEYALLLALIAVVCIAAVTFLGTATSEPYSELSSQLG